MPIPPQSGDPPIGMPILAPGAFVRHPDCPDWGIGQVQSVDGARVTVNFENAGKQLINIRVILLSHADPDAEP